jgi:hypothetical protein
MSATLALKPIETRYQGYRFRSRLESRYAVFLDHLRIPWRYEPEGFDLPSGPYLPDFWLPDLKCWIEIKPGDPTDDENAKCRDLATASECPVFMFCGAIGDHLFGEFGASDGAYRFDPGGDWDNYYAWCECTSCGKFGIQFEGRSDRLPCKSGKCKRSSHGDKGRTANTARLIRAYTAARSARFEHGEFPEP